MRVRTLKKHGNAFGETYTKKPPVAYDLPDDNVQALIDAGYVEEAAKQPPTAVVAKVSGAAA